MRKTSSEIRRCYKIHSLPAGSQSSDTNLCETPLVSYEKCVDIVEVRNNYIALDSPYLCDLRKD